MDHPEMLPAIIFLLILVAILCAYLCIERRRDKKYNQFLEDLKEAQERKRFMEKLVVNNQVVKAPEKPIHPLKRRMKTPVRRSVHRTESASSMIYPPPSTYDHNDCGGISSSFDSGGSSYDGGCSGFDSGGGCD